MHSAIQFCFFVVCVSTLLPVSRASFYHSSYYDVGCYASRRARYATGQILPTCTEGGLWKHYQCLSIFKCYCTFVDTGYAFPLISYWSRTFFYPYFAVASSCPVKFQRSKPSDNQCEKPALQYPCDLSTARYVFNRHSQTCEESYRCYGFLSRSECESQCTVQTYDECSHRVDAGWNCVNRSEETRYRHEPFTGQCVPFTYRGCGGNTNNYEHMFECQRSCVPQTNVSVIVQVGALNYNLSLPQWAANRFQLLFNETNHINESTFGTIGEHVIDFSLLTDDTHDGSRTLTLVNHRPGFKPIEEQEREIFGWEVICRLPPVTDPCRAYNPRWFYNSTEGKCSKFVYGGCSGNGNNFQTADECSTYCRAPYTPSPLELVAFPTDPAGNELHGPLGHNRGESNGKGEVVYKVPSTTPPPTTTPPLLISTILSSISEAEGSA